MENNCKAYADCPRGVPKCGMSIPISDSSSTAFGRASSNRSIKMYNVKFGDCFIIKSDENRLLVDFGSKSKISDIQKSFDQAVLDIKSNDNIDCLITHFHEDHVICLKEAVEKKLLSRCFSKVYLPNVYESANMVEYFLGEIAAKASTSNAWNYAYYAIYSYIHLHKLIKRRRKFTFVSEGYDFKVGNTDFHVLLPSQNILEKFKNAAAKFSSKFTTVEDEELKSLASKIFSLEADNDSGLSDDDYDHEVDVASDEFEKLVKKALESKASKSKKTNFAMLNELANDGSIVFASQDCKLLMLGDATKESICSIVSSKPDYFSRDKDYSVIKVQHHGTLAHFVPCLPNAETMLISNGKQSTWYISCKYYLFYDSAFVCSNHDGCEFFNNHGCRCSNGTKPESKCGIDICEEIPF